MKPTEITLRTGGFTLQLNIPAFFDGASVTSIKRAFALLREDLRENGDVVSRLRIALADWIFFIHCNCSSARRRVREAADTLSKDEALIAAFGSLATTEMKKRLKLERRELKDARAVAKSLHVRLERALKIKNIFEESVENIDY